jgi:hypothetical protein
MKKFSVICIIIVSVILISGCTGGDKSIDSNALNDAQTNQKLDTKASDLLIKPSDVPGLTLKNFGFIAVPKSSSYIYSNSSSGDIEMSSYQDTLPIGTRNVGQSSIWLDNSGRMLQIESHKYDSNANFQFDYIQVCGILTEQNKNYSDVMDFGCGNPSIGDNSYYQYGIDKKNKPDVAITQLVFTYRNNIVEIRNTDEKEKSVNEAIRIAKIIKSTLD